MVFNYFLFLGGTLPAMCIEIIPTAVSWAVCYNILLYIFVARSALDLRVMQDH